jgi:hypothetical protein
MFSSTGQGQNEVFEGFFFLCAVRAVLLSDGCSYVSIWCFGGTGAKQSVYANLFPEVFYCKYGSMTLLHLESIDDGSLSDKACYMLY